MAFLTSAAPSFSRLLGGRQMVSASAAAVATATRLLSTQAGSASSGRSHNSSSNSNNCYRMAAVGLASLTTGFLAGRQSFRQPYEDELVLPNGLPRSCCEAPALTAEQQELVTSLKRIVGKENLLDGREENTTTTKFLKGARLGKGTALAIVRPQTLKQVVDAVQAVVDAKCVVLVQGSNTGLTGGSVPRQQSDGRPTVVISMKHFDTVFPIDDGRRVVCMAGVGLADLLTFVKSNFPNRESHSVLGSTFLNPTTAAGTYCGGGPTEWLPELNGSCLTLLLFMFSCQALLLVREGRSVVRVRLSPKERCT